MVRVGTPVAKVDYFTRCDPNSDGTLTWRYWSIRTGVAARPRLYGWIPGALPGHGAIGRRKPVVRSPGAPVCWPRRPAAAGRGRDERWRIRYLRGTEITRRDLLRAGAGLGLAGGLLYLPGGNLLQAAQAADFDEVDTS